MEEISHVIRSLTDKNTIDTLKKKILSPTIYKILEEKLSTHPADFTEFFATLYEWYKSGDIGQQLCLLQFIPLLTKFYVFQDDHYAPFLCVYNCEIQSRQRTSVENKNNYIPGDKP